MYDLSGKVALVTGAGGKRGIGRAIALRLADEGAAVAVNDLDGPGVRGVARELDQRGGGVIAVPGDVADAAQVDGMVAQAIDRFGRIDILVNSAASKPGADRVAVVELEENAWDHVQRVNVKGTFLCCRAVVRRMIERGGGGKIINLSSTTGKQAIARMAAYSASKSAIIGFTQALALEVAPHRINVNAICPGMVDTDRIEHLAAAMAPEGVSAQEHHGRMLEERVRRIPLGRLAESADVAAMAAFLASAQSHYLTGLALNVNGGSDMR